MVVGPVSATSACTSSRPGIEFGFDFSLDSLLRVVRVGFRVVEKCVNWLKCDFHEEKLLFDENNYFLGISCAKTSPAKPYLTHSIIPAPLFVPRVLGQIITPQVSMPIVLGRFPALFIMRIIVGMLWCAHVTNL